KPFESNESVNRIRGNCRVSHRRRIRPGGQQPPAFDALACLCGSLGSRRPDALVERCLDSKPPGFHRSTPSSAAYRGQTCCKNMSTCVETSAKEALKMEARRTAQDLWKRYHQQADTHTENDL